MSQILKLKIRCGICNTEAHIPFINTANNIEGEEGHNYYSFVCPNCNAHYNIILEEHGIV